MRHSLYYPLAVLVALATGIALLGLATTISSKPVTVPSKPSADVTDAVHRFYDAADAFLRTGDDAPLRAVVTPTYRESTEHTTTPTGVGGFVAFLGNLRAACADCQLQVKDLSIGQSDATVHVSARGTRQGTLNGHSLTGIPVDWSAIEMLRIQDRQIAERWSQGTSLSQGNELFSEVEVAVPSGLAILQATRQVLAVGASLPPILRSGPTMVIVEAGTLTVQSEEVRRSGTATQRSVGEREKILAQCDRLVIEPDTRPRMRNDGPTPTVLLMISLTNIDPEVVATRDPRIEP